MSLLLDALKKAALEKQRREQDVGAPPDAAERAAGHGAATLAGTGQAETPAKPKATARAQGANLLPIWAKQKQKHAALADSFETSPSVNPEAERPAMVGNSAGPTAPEQQEADELCSAVESAELGLEDCAAAEAECTHIDISDLDFADLVGFVAEPEPVNRMASLSLVPAPNLVDFADLTGEPQAAQSRQAPEAAGPLEHFEGASKQPSAARPDAEVEPAVVKSAPEEARVEPAAVQAEPGAADSAQQPKQIEDDPAALPNNSTQAAPGPVKHTQLAAKQALNELLHNSQQAANRSRKRLLRMYALLVATACGLVGAYYVLLQQGASPLLARPAQTALVASPLPGEQPAAQSPETPAPETTSPESSAPETSAQTLPAQTLPPTLPTEPQASAAEILTPGNASGNSDLAPGRKTTSAVATASKPEQTSQGMAAAGVAAEDTAVPVANLHEASAEPDRFNGEVLEPVEVPIRVPTTSVLAYQPVAVDELATAVEAGFAAYEAGDMASAAQAYQSALRLDPYQRDALLGAASVALRQGRPNDALSYYQQRLARAPKDDFALAGVLALGAQGEANAQLDAELSRLLAAYPQAAHLHYLQGTLLAQRQQWGAAQLALLAAWQLDNRNPDIACNLAIAFDHLQQPEEAARFYRQALSLANGQSASFASGAIRTRLAELEGPQVKEPRR